MIAIFSLSHPDPRQKLTHAGFSFSRKTLVVVSNESWLIFETCRFMSYMWLIYMRYAYIMNQNFTTIFLPTIFFPKPPTQNFENCFFPKCVGKIFCRFQIRKLRKISR